MEEKSIQFNKTLYGLKGALDYLDEEFGEFAISPTTPEDWFRMWDSIFYDLAKREHNYFFKKSESYVYPNGYENPRLVDIEELKQGLMTLQRQIDEVERNHFFFNNGNFLMSKYYRDNPTSGINNGDCYYLQSGKRRKITGGALDTQGGLITPTNVYNNLKTRKRKNLGPISDQDLILFVSEQTISGIINGPVVRKLEDIFLSSLEVNIYPRTLDEYNNLTFEQMFNNIRLHGFNHYAVPIRD